MLLNYAAPLSTRNQKRHKHRQGSLGHKSILRFQVPGLNGAIMGMWMISESAGKIPSIPH